MNVTVRATDNDAPSPPEASDGRQATRENVSAKGLTAPALTKKKRPLEIIPTSMPDAQFSMIRGDSDRLVISFNAAGRLKRHPNTDPEFFGSTYQKGTNSVLFVSDISRSWMNRKGWINEIVARSDEMRERIGAKHICGVGASMGAFSALVMASHMRFDRILALTPQFSVDPRVVPDETRWMKYRSGIDKIRVSKIEALPDEVEIFTLNGADESELRHALRLPKASNTRHFIFSGYGHALAARLARQRKLQPIVSAFVNGDLDTSRRLIRRAGGIPRRRHIRLARQAARAAQSASAE